MNVLLEYSLPLLRINGIFVAYKTETTITYLNSMDNIIKLLGGKLEKTIFYSLRNKDLKRVLIIIKKISTTPEQFPRKPGIPSKRPLN